jgi:uncharacterized membrane protein YidH (DUF202 family)
MSKEPEDEGLGNLGSLAQSARLKHLNTARWILIVVGVLTLGLNAVLLATMRDQLRGLPNFDQLMKLYTLIAAIGMCLGVIFVVLGILVKTFPVACTILGLVLYAGGNLFFFVISEDPKMLYQGIIIKVIIIVAMVKSIQAAVAYQKEIQADSFRAEYHE